MKSKSIDDDFIKRHVTQSLREDLGEGDVTTELLSDPDKVRHAEIIARDEGILSGRNVAEHCFLSVPEITSYSGELISFNWHYADGDHLLPGTTIGEIQGATGLILSAERVALNYLQQLSAVATKTNMFVEVAQEYEVQIYDTRKTIPHHRTLQKYSVRCGGGSNHRVDLSEAVLIKDNHKKIADNLPALIEGAESTDLPVIVEVHELNELKNTLKGIFDSENFDIDVIMLDNISPTNIDEFMELIPETIEVEASGGINISNLEEYCKTGIDRVSVGSLTHSLSSLDISLEI